MADRCRFADGLRERRRDGAERELESHLSRCPACRRQWVVEAGLLEAFRGVARPALSPHFPRQLRDLVREERLRMATARRRRRWMQLYWAAACLACAGVVGLVPWPAEGLSGLGRAALLLALTVVAAPAALLLRACRADLLALILGTVDPLEPEPEA